MITISDYFPESIEYTMNLTHLPLTSLLTSKEESRELDRSIVRTASVHTTAARYTWVERSRKLVTKRGLVAIPEWRSVHRGVLATSTSSPRSSREALAGDL